MTSAVNIAKWNPLNPSNKYYGTWYWQKFSQSIQHHRASTLSHLVREMWLLNAWLSDTFLFFICLCFFFSEANLISKLALTCGAYWRVTFTDGWRLGDWGAFFKIRRIIHEKFQNLVIVSVQITINNYSYDI